MNDLFTCLPRYGFRVVTVNDCRSCGKRLNEHFSQSSRRCCLFIVSTKNTVDTHPPTWHKEIVHNMCFLLKKKGVCQLVLWQKPTQLVVNTIKGVCWVPLMIACEMMRKCEGSLHLWWWAYMPHVLFYALQSKMLTSRNSAMPTSMSTRIKTKREVTSTPSINQTHPLSLSFNLHSTRPGLRPWRDSPRLSILRLCGWHTASWFTDRRWQIWLWLLWLQCEASTFHFWWCLNGKRRKEQKCFEEFWKVPSCPIMALKSDRKSHQRPLTQAMPLPTALQVHQT